MHPLFIQYTHNTHKHTQTYTIHTQYTHNTLRNTQCAHTINTHPSLPSLTHHTALYKGMGATLVGAMPYQGLKFGAYETLKRFADAMIGVDDGMVMMCVCVC